MSRSPSQNRCVGEVADLGQEDAEAGSLLKDELAISPVIGTILIVVMAVGAGTGAAAVSMGMVDLPSAAPEENHRITDASGEVGAGQHDELFTMEHQGGDRIKISELGALVEGGGKKISTDNGTLELEEDGDGDGYLETGEGVTLKEACPDNEQAKESEDDSGAKESEEDSGDEEDDSGDGESDSEGDSGDKDKGHGNDEDGFDEDNPGNSDGVGNTATTRGGGELVLLADNGNGKGNGNGDNGEGNDGEDDSGDSDKGHGNDADGNDEDNPGKSEGKDEGDDGESDSEEGDSEDEGEDDSEGESEDDSEDGEKELCGDLGDIDSVEVTIYHEPSGEVLEDTGVNVK